MNENLSPQAMLKIEYRDIGTLKPYANNARKHPRNQVRKLAASLKTFNWTNPLIIGPDGTILCGHGRYACCRNSRLLPARISSSIAFALSPLAIVAVAVSAATIALWRSIVAARVLL